jgi:hypothetical protein
LLLKIKQDKKQDQSKASKLAVERGARQGKGRVGEEYYHIDERREVLVCLLWQAHQ